MKPEMTALLSEIIGAAEKTLDRPTGDPRRLDQLEKLFDRVGEACNWPTDQPRRLCDESTALLMTQLRAIERLGLFGDRHELSWRATVAAALLPYVKADLGQALEIVRNAGRGEKVNA